MSGLHLRSRLQGRLLRPRLRLIRLLVCDVDGVLTDGGLHYDEQGRVVKRFDVRDGLAVRMLQRAGITVALLSGGRSGAIEQRARHLGIEHCQVGVGDKRRGLEQLRLIEAGIPIATFALEADCFSVDTPEQLEQARRWLAMQG